MSDMPISTGVEATTPPSDFDVAAHEDNDRSSSKSDASHDPTTDRKVISHLFGRNKVCTRQIPEHFFEKYPRKRYQRFRYGGSSRWAFQQLNLLRCQIENMEKWGAVRSWAIELKAAKKRQIKQEDAEKARTATGIENGLPRGSRPGCVERFLLPHLGPRKSFGDVYLVLDVINKNLRERAVHERSFPGVEFLPNIDIKQHPPRPLKGKPKSSLPLEIRATKEHPSSPLKGKSKSPLPLEARDTEQHCPGPLEESKSSLSLDARDTEQHFAGPLEESQPSLSLETLETLGTLGTSDLVKLWLKEKAAFERPTVGQ